MSARVCNVIAFFLFAVGTGLTAHASNVDLPVPAEITSAQRAALQQKFQMAKDASEAATPHVLDFFASESFRSAIRACCPDAAQMSPQELLNRFRSEVQVTELAHAFRAVAEDTDHFTDESLDSLLNFDWFLNEWQVGYMEGDNSSKVRQNDAAVEVFGLPVCPSTNYTWEQASDRLIYVAHNLYQADTGSNPNFGDVTIIFSNEYVKEMVLIAPMDTGRWSMSCDHNYDPMETALSFPPPGPHHFGHRVNCSAWQPVVVGTLEHHDHIILANWGLSANNSIANQTVVDQSRGFFERSAFAGAYDGLPNLTVNEYWEANIVGNPRLSQSVQFIIGGFASLFGTSTGRKLQTVANHFSWPLVWALGDGLPSDDRPHGLFPYGPSGGHHPSFGTPSPGNQRVLDPANAALYTNATTSKSVADCFEAIWSLAEEARAKGIITQKQIFQWWEQLKMVQTRVAPLTSQSCSTPGRCIGTNVQTNECICKKAATFIV